MSYIMVDIESNGPIPGDYSMFSIGAVVVNEKLNKRYLKNLKPLNENFDPEALKACGFNQEEIMSCENDPKEVMLDFEKWILENSKGKTIFISDNNGFDFMFVHWYFMHFLGRDPFGYSSQNLDSFYKGVVLNVFENFKHLRRTKHTHNALDDVLGNAEALLAIKRKYKIRIPLE